MLEKSRADARAAERQFIPRSVSDAEWVAGRSNLWCYVTKYGLNAGPKFTELNSGPSRLVNPFTVSFIGISGHGRSFVIRGLINGNLKPIVALPGSNGSVSCDLTAYLLNPDDPSNSMIFIESEGLGGSDTVARMAYKLDLSLEEKYKTVLFFPKLLVGCSDVVCFVFAGEMREVMTCFMRVEEYAKKAFVGAHAARPALILIFNKSRNLGADYYARDLWKESFPQEYATTISSSTI